MIILNVGCGNSTIAGAVNMDNSLSVKLARHPVLTKLLYCLHLYGAETQRYIAEIRNSDIIYGKATALPFSDGTVDVIYSSHMVEHLYQEDFIRFLDESYRVLRKGGILRLALPDISICVEQYREDGDADSFCESLYMGKRHKMTFVQRIKYLLIGDRGHKWMYDGASVERLVEENTAFANVWILRAGESYIYGEHNIDLCERYNESVYIECKK